MKTHVYRKIMCLQIFRTCLFVITRSRWPSVGEYLNKPYTSTTRQQKVTTIDTIYINLQKIMLSVKKQPPKVTNCMGLFIYN